MSRIVPTVRDRLVGQGASEQAGNVIAWLGLALLIVFLAVLANWIAKRVLLTGIQHFVRKTKTQWDDVLVERKVFERLSHLAPALVIYFAAPLFLSFSEIIRRFSMIYMLLAGLLVANAFLSGVAAIYETYQVSRHRPIKGYIQVVQTILVIFVLIVSLGMLLNQSPWVYLSGLGAMTAVLLLIFRDSILGLVASIQLTQNDMVRIGDWIAMPKYGADGEVVDVTLTTVKVRNWDMTITTIPAYALISDSFVNWRGMQESGGRRIKRSLSIDVGSIRFVDEDLLARFRRFEPIRRYVETRQEEIEEHNRERGVDTSVLINGRRMTNVGCFRAYALAYLRNHPMIHQEMTFLVRHLPPGAEGLPIEVYVFSKDTRWARYEEIQADIFDHLLAAVPHFDLRIFQSPSGHDLRTLAEAKRS